jgi:hypothetical protein
MCNLQRSLDGKGRKEPDNLGRLAWGGPRLRSKVVSKGAFAAAVCATLHLEVRVTLFLIASPQVFNGAESLKGILAAAVANLSARTLWADVARVGIISGLDMGFFNSYSPVKSFQFLL